MFIVMTTSLSVREVVSGMAAILLLVAFGAKTMAMSKEVADLSMDVHRVGIRDGTGECDASASVSSISPFVVSLSASASRQYETTIRVADGLDADGFLAFCRSDATTLDKYLLVGNALLLVRRMAGDKQVVADIQSRTASPMPATSVHLPPLDKPVTVFAYRLPKNL